MTLETPERGHGNAGRPSKARRLLETVRARLAALGPWWHLLFFSAGWLLLQLRVVRQVRRALVLFVFPGEARRLILNGPVGEDTAWSALLEFVSFGAVLAAVWVMSRIERRPPAHGLPLDRGAAPSLGAGVLLGLGAMGVVVGGLWATGALRFDSVLLTVPDALRSGMLWAIGCFAVALFEESLFRGYPLRTLGSAIRFWPAAVVLSSLFGAAHGFNPGENARGLFSAFAFGLLFCLLIRRTGSLWTAVGFHLAWNWMEAFLFGMPDSGVLSHGRLLEASLRGPAWLTGGTAGPEGSVMCAPALLLVLLVVLLSPAGSRRSIPPAEASRPV
ncbi:MAG TPA: CPBP family intramembrane glutamic endopeptidase [Verrucomicrobiae bacterium]|nr:CPBP family intramembrane glutamic endopeptidase [Verrucomicrobiae bacterium]